MKPFKDEDIIQAFKAGGKAAEAALGQLYRDAGYRRLADEAARSFGGNADDVEDLVQEGLWRVYQKIRAGSFEELSSIKTFFGGIVKNIARNEQAKRARQSLHLQTLAASEGQLLDDLAWAEITHLLDTAFNTLEPKCQQILELWKLGHPLTEIQAALGFNDLDSLKNKKKNCLKNLREWMLRHPEAAKYFKKK